MNKTTFNVFINTGSRIVLYPLLLEKMRFWLHVKAGLCYIHSNRRELAGVNCFVGGSSRCFTWISTKLEK